VKKKIEKCVEIKVKDTKQIKQPTESENVIIKANEYDCRNVIIKVWI